MIHLRGPTWLRRPRQYEDTYFLEASAEVYALRKQVERLKDGWEKDKREFQEERREWLRKEETYIEVNHDLAAKLCASDAQLVAYGLERR